MRTVAVLCLLLVCLTGIYFTYSLSQSMSSFEARQKSLLQKFDTARKKENPKRTATANAQRKSMNPITPQSDGTHEKAQLDPNGILDETNTMRKNFGVSPLTLNPALSAAAIERARHMFRVGYFDHNAPDGQSFDLPIKMTGYEMLLSGENIALGNFANNHELVQAWYDSLGHKKNLLFGGFSEIGIAALKGTFQGRRTWISVQVFATPQSGCSFPDQDMKKNIDVLRANNSKRIELLEVYKEALQHHSTSKEKFKEFQEKFEQELELFEEEKELMNNDVQSYNEQVGKYNTCAQQLAASYAEFKP